MKYQLLLRDLYKYTERAHLTSEMDTLRQATHVMHVVPKAANDMMDVGRLQGFDVSRNIIAKEEKNIKPFVLKLNLEQTKLTCMA